MSWPSVYDTPNHIAAFGTLSIMLIDGVNTTSCCGTAVLWVLSESDGLLYSIPVKTVTDVSYNYTSNAEINLLVVLHKKQHKSSNSSL